MRKAGISFLYWCKIKHNKANKQAFTEIFIFL